MHAMLIVSMSGKWHCLFFFSSRWLSRPSNKVRTLFTITETGTNVFVTLFIPKRLAAARFSTATGKGSHVSVFAFIVGFDGLAGIISIH